MARNTTIGAALIVLATAGRGVAAAEGEAPVIPVIQQQYVQGGAREGEAKDPLQFGPLKAGLDAMIRGESVNNFNLNDVTHTPGHRDSRLLVRVRPSLTVTPTDYLTARVEGQWYASYNDVKFNTFRLYQGYLEGSLPGRKATLKAGRQELVYGSSFMLGADTFFDGLSYDAVKLMVKPMEPLAVDFFAGKYLKDNSGGITGELYGVYGTYTANDAFSVDIYGLLDTGGAGMTHDGKDERTWSVGARLAGKVGSWSLSRWNRSTSSAGISRRLPTGTSAPSAATPTCPSTRLSAAIRPRGSSATPSVPATEAGTGSSGSSTTPTTTPPSSAT